MRRMFITAASVWMLLSLSGCSIFGYWLSGCGGEDADLVVINDSVSVVYSIALDYESQTTVVADAGGRAMLERGESCGLALEEGAEAVTVTLYDVDQRELARRLVAFEGQRLYVTLKEDGSLDCTADMPEDAG